MRILVTGAEGQLGRDVCKELKTRGVSCWGPDRRALDITEAAAVERAMGDYRPDAVIHCAAWTGVDRAEAYPEEAWRVNALGTRGLAAACRRAGASMLYVSTDYVFPGAGTDAYRPEDPVSPVNVYGRTKAEGEQATLAELERCFIVRTSWLFGGRGPNFVQTMLGLSEKRRELHVVCDQISSPTYTADLAPLLCDMVETERYGIYHATNEGFCSWAQFAEEIFCLAGKQVTVHPISTAEYPAPAARPLNSRMSKDKLRSMGFQPLPDWQDALARYLKEAGVKP